MVGDRSEIKGSRLSNCRAGFPDCGDSILSSFTGGTMKRVARILVVLLLAMSGFASGNGGRSSKMPL